MTFEVFLFIIPVLVWIMACKLLFSYEFTWPEVAVQGIATSLVLVAIFAIGSSMQTSDVMFVNGSVERLDVRQKSCQSGWERSRDNHCTNYRTRQVKTGRSCSTNSDGKKTCHNTYATEYKYIYNWERRYYVYADITKFEVNRVDSQGVKTPPQFAEINVGTPVAAQKSFTNYIKGASSSLFNESMEGESVVLTYPRVTGHYKTNRVIVQGTKIDTVMWRKWNNDVMQLNADIRKTGANAIIVVTGSQKSFATMLSRSWDAHNINDVVTVIGMKDDKISWVDVSSWSDTSVVNLEIRDKIIELKTLDSVAITAIIKDAITSGFKLKSMDEFEYLADDIAPPTWVYFLAGLMLLLVTPAITYIFNKYEIF
jgi:hypothetical protein